jgi:sugar phosphate isomerase/epimerase
VAATFAGVCDEAAEHGMRATIEFTLRTQVPDVTTAARVVELAGRPNGAVLLDTWHFHYGPSTVEALGLLDGGSIGSIQVSDGPAERPEDYGFATRYRRLPPGEGDFDLGGVLRTLDRIGYTGPLTAEVFNEPMLAAVGPHAFARRIFEALRAADISTT